MAERRGLGRGLSALLDETQAAADGRRTGGVLDLPIELIEPNPDQPRRRFDESELAELAASIAERGILQPILVRRLAGRDGVYQIVAGERRWRAAQKARIRTVPALVRDLDDREVMEVALIENIQRADLSPLEEARGYEMLSGKYGHTAEAIAAAVGKSRSHVANTVRLLRLPAAVQAHLGAGRLTAGHARAILDAPGAEALASEIIRRGLNVRQTEALARSVKSPTPAAAKPGDGAPSAAKSVARADADSRALAADLAETLGLAVEIHHKGSSGEVRIAYRTLEQLDDLCSRLSRPPPTFSS